MRAGSSDNRSNKTRKEVMYIIALIRIVMETRPNHVKTFISETVFYQRSKKKQVEWC